MKNLALITALLVIYGCAAKGNIESAIDELKGNSINHAIAYLGQPNAYVKLPSLHKYIWTKKSVIEFPSSYYKYDSSGDRYYATEENELEFECTIEIYTNPKFEISSSYVSGDNLGCTEYSSDLKGLHKNSDFRLVQRLNSTKERYCYFICDNNTSHVSSCNNNFIYVNDMQCKKDKKIKSVKKSKK